jgi:hypothetical protein
LNAVIPLSGNDYSCVAPDSHNASNLGSTLSQSTMAIFNAPSIIPAHNPALRVYTYDTDGSDYPFGTILNWDQYYVDLNAANQNGKVGFQIEYKASDLYGVDHFDGPGVGQAIFNVANDQNLLNLYTQYVNVSSI